MRLKYVLDIISGPRKGTMFELARKETVIGRAQDCHLCLEDDEVSRRHCSIVLSPGKVLLTDHGSANGTRVNGSSADKTILNSGDLINIGKTEMRLSSREDDSFDCDKTQMHAVNRGESIRDRIRNIGWSSRIMLILLVAALISHALIAWPLISQQRKMASQEALSKARALVIALSALNQEALRIGDEMLLDVDRISRHEGVVEAYVYDQNGRILAPVSRFLETPDDQASRRAVLAEERIMVEIRDGVYDLAEPIRVYDVHAGQFVRIGTARIIFSLHSITSLEQGIRRNAVISLVALLLVAAIVASAIGRVTRRPLIQLRDDLEEALKGDRNKVRDRLGFRAFDNLAASINRALIKTSASAMGSSEERVENEREVSLSKSMSSAIGPLADTLPDMVTDAVMAADAENNVLLVNPAFCRLMQISPDIKGRHFFDAFPDQSILSGVMKLIQEAISSHENTAVSSISCSGTRLQARVAVIPASRKDEFERVVVVLSSSSKENTHES